LLIPGNHGFQALLGFRAADPRQSKAGFLAGQTAYYLIQELQTIGEALRGRSGIAHANRETVQILLNALHHELEALQIPAHSLELLHPDRTGKIAQLRQQLRRQFTSLLIGRLNTFHGGSSVTDRFHGIRQLAPRGRVTGSVTRSPVRHGAAQGLQARHALGERIESARLAPQRILRLERNALHHEGQLFAGAVTGAVSCMSSVSAAAPAKHSTMSAASTGKKFTLEPVSFRVIICSLT